MYLEDHYLRKKKMVKRSDMTVNEVTSERRKYREETLLEDIIAPNILNYWKAKYPKLGVLQTARWYKSKESHC